MVTHREWQGDYLTQVSHIGGIIKNDKQCHFTSCAESHSKIVLTGTLI